MKKPLFLSLILALLVIPSLTFANTFFGPIYGVVVRVPSANCGYAIVYDNKYNYDILMEYGNDLENGDYLYGGFQYGNHVFYNARSKQGVSAYVSEMYLSQLTVVNDYKTYCPNY